MYRDAGLRHLLTVAGLYAPATVTNILAGKDFYRGLTDFRLVDKALIIRFLNNFEAWCYDNSNEIHQ